MTKYLLALSLIAHGQKTEAEALLSGLVNTGSQDAQIYYHLGQLQLERGDEKAAVGNLEVAAKMTPEDETIHRALAEAYRKNDQPKEAERESELLQAPKPDTLGFLSQMQTRRLPAFLPSQTSSSGLRKPA